MSAKADSGILEITMRSFCVHLMYTRVIQEEGTIKKAQSLAYVQAYEQSLTDVGVGGSKGCVHLRCCQRADCASHKQLADSTPHQFPRRVPALTSLDNGLSCKMK